MKRPLSHAWTTACPGLRRNGRDRRSAGGLRGLCFRAPCCAVSLSGLRVRVRVSDAERRDLLRRSDLDWSSRGLACFLRIDSMSVGSREGRGGDRARRVSRETPAVPYGAVHVQTWCQSRAERRADGPFLALPGERPASHHRWTASRRPRPRAPCLGGAVASSRPGRGVLYLFEPSRASLGGAATRLLYGGRRETDSGGSVVPSSPTWRVARAWHVAGAAQVWGIRNVARAVTLDVRELFDRRWRGDIAAAPWTKRRPMRAMGLTAAGSTVGLRACGAAAVAPGRASSASTRAFTCSAAPCRLAVSRGTGVSIEGARIGRTRLHTRTATVARTHGVREVNSVDAPNSHANACGPYEHAREVGDRGDEAGGARARGYATSSRCRESGRPDGERWLLSSDLPLPGPGFRPPASGFALRASRR